METIKHNVSTYNSDIQGVFMVERLPIGSNVLINGDLHTVQSNITLRASYYPKSNILVFKVDSHSINNSRKVADILLKSGLSNVREFNVIYMNGSIADGSCMYKELVYCSFKNFSIFDV